MKSKTIGSLFVVLTLVVGIMAFTPSAFADTTVSMIKGAGASASADCVSAKNCFDPANAQVASGDTVTWTNDDTASHTVTSGTLSDETSVGKLFDSGLVKVGGTFAFKFTDAGTFDYFCQVHPWMTGQVIVGTANAPTSEPTTTNPTTDNNTAVPEFGPIASLVLVIAIVSVVAVTAKTRGFLKL